MTKQKYYTPFDKADLIKKCGGATRFCISKLNRKRLRIAPVRLREKKRNQTSIVK